MTAKKSRKKRVFEIVCDQCGKDIGEIIAKNIEEVQDMLSDSNTLRPFWPSEPGSDWPHYCHKCDSYLCGKHIETTYDSDRFSHDVYKKHKRCKK